MSVVHFVMPDGIDDPVRPSGGNVYDRRICRGLAAIGWSVHEHAVPGPWPGLDAAACATLTGVLAGLPDGAVVLLDGLIASTVPQVLVPEAKRLCLVVLVHMPLGNELPTDGHPTDKVAKARARECAVLSAAVAIVTTSAWTKTWLLEQYALQPGRIHIAEPGVDAADLAPGTAVGGELLCVAAVAPHKGHDVLLAALGMLGHLAWRCTCVGSLRRDPGFVERLRQEALELGIGDRLRYTGPLVAEDLGTAYAGADVLVLASRGESYGMVVTEALARGLPVIATAVGGIPQALGLDADGSPPGLLVPPDDPAALAKALRAWLGDADLRRRLRRTAGKRRVTLSGWSIAADRISRVMAELA